MSNLVVPDEGKKRNLIGAMGVAGFAPTTVKLFQNNYFPDHATVVASLTEATFSNYSAQSLAGLSVSSSLDASGRAVATFNPVSFTKSGATGNNIYGYYVCDPSGFVLWAERFDSAPISMAVDGAFIQIVPKFTTASQYSNT